VEWLVVSLSLLTAATILIQGFLAYALLKRKIGGLRQSGLVRAMFSFVIAVIPAAAIGYTMLAWLGGVDANSWALSGVLPAMIAAALVAGSMVLSYAALLWLIRNPELRELSKQLRRKIKRDGR
jgi:putative peptidoglycan lipid II flippase